MAGPSEQIEIKPDTDVQTVVQAATSPTVIISVPSENGKQPCSQAVMKLGVVGLASPQKGRTYN